jgi:6-phosphogluconolactonase
MGAEARVSWNRFAGQAELAEAVADAVAQRLQAAIGARGAAIMAVSGGTTPAPFFRALSGRPLAWDKVTVTLVDERFVPMSSPRSNAALVADDLLQGPAATARFVGLYHPAASAEAGAGLASQALAGLGWPLDIAVLGMGQDGHTASFFPDATDLPTLLDPQSQALVLPVEAASAGEPRLTLALPRIAGAGFVALHIEGETKRKVAEAALAPGSRLPIRAVIDHALRPVEIFWAP